MFLSNKPKGTEIPLSKNEVLPPQLEGGELHSGLPKGQISDYRFMSPDCTGLHVREFNSHYTAHIDQVHPDCSLVEHLRKDAPPIYKAATTGVGALVGGLIGGKTGALLGGGLGFLFGEITSED